MRVKSRSGVSVAASVFGFALAFLFVLPINVALGALTGWVIEWWFPRTAQMWLELLLPWDGVKLYQVTALAALALAYLNAAFARNKD